MTTSWDDRPHCSLKKIIEQCSQRSREQRQGSREFLFSGINSTVKALRINTKEHNALGLLFSGHSLCFFPSSEFTSRECGVWSINENSYQKLEVLSKYLYTENQKVAILELVFYQVIQVIFSLELLRFYLQVKSQDYKSP